MGAGLNGSVDVLPLITYHGGIRDCCSGFSVSWKSIYPNLVKGPCLILVIE
jgi:hypothetical protein